MGSNYEWKSDIAFLTKDYLLMKESTGYEIALHERWLKRFDYYYYRLGYTGVFLTKNMTDDFIYNNGEESKGTIYKKEIIMSDFGAFLKNNGFHAYICERKSNEKFYPSHTYVFSKDEIARIFSTIDTYRVSKYTNKSLVDPVLFRLLYACGLRSGEAVRLKCDDIDYDAGTIYIRKSKNSKDRKIPVCTSVMERMRELEQDIHYFSKQGTYFFKSPKGENPLDKSTIYRRFRDYLLIADIPHTGHGPRVHDLRHTFAVHSLKKMILNGEELVNIMPYMAAYMGHTDFRGTQYYLRLTADLYPHIISKTEAAFGYVIPEGGVLDESEE